VLLSVLMSSSPTAALEVDTIYAWGRPIEDASDVLNAKFDLEIRAAVERAEADHRGREPTCEDVTEAVGERLEFEIFHPVDLWAEQTPLIERVPGGGEETAEYRRRNMYHDAAWLDIGMWMPITPVINVDGVYLGIDKLAHFVSSGWRYHGVYQRARRDGLDHVAAEQAAIRWGILEERTINGKVSTGVLSRGDLEANHGGLRFYLELCAAPDPILELVDGRWSVVRPFDIRRYMSPEWDEGYQPSVFAGYRWRAVRPVLEGYCGKLDDPEVQRLLSDYRARDRITATEEVFSEFVQKGEIADPQPFAFVSMCATTADVAHTTRGSPARGGGSNEHPDDPERRAELQRRILELEADRPLRVFGLLAAHVDRPKGVSASVGGMFAHPRRTDDCHEVCLLRGVYAQGELGLYGAQMSVGWGAVVGDTGRTDRLVTAVYLAAGIEAALLRTWSGSPLDPETQTLAGVEGQFSVARVGMRLGAFYRLTDGDLGGRWVVTGAFGWGF